MKIAEWINVANLNNNSEELNEYSSYRNVWSW